MEARKVITDLQKYVKVRRVETEEESFIECRYKEGTQKIEFQTEREDIPGITAILVAIKILDEENISKIYSINYAEKGYEIRPRGNEPVLPYGELTICGQSAIAKKPKLLMRKIKKTR
ncbi:hypothetical protein ACJMK2_018868 [Sinanodonta woodiana]|uniref:Uncharacterized protein n=1 Tax=Sinanodonta woodiana TaxID=1069815 RepID=A0ABD3UGR5_SINWO